MSGFRALAFNPQPYPARGAFIIAWLPVLKHVRASFVVFSVGWTFGLGGPKEFSPFCRLQCPTSK